MVLMIVALGKQYIMSDHRDFDYIKLLLDLWEWLSNIF